MLPFPKTIKKTMNNPNLKYAIILIVLVALGFLAHKWVSDNKEAAIREAIAQKEGEITILKQTLSKDSIQGIRLKHIADSALSSIHYSDTVIVRIRDNGKIESIKKLGTDSAISFLRSRLR